MHPSVTRCTMVTYLCLQLKLPQCISDNLLSPVNCSEIGCLPWKMNNLRLSLPVFQQWLKNILYSCGLILTRLKDSASTQFLWTDTKQMSSKTTIEKVCQMFGFDLNTVASSRPRLLKTAAICIHSYIYKYITHAHSHMHRHTNFLIPRLLDFNIYKTD